MNDDKIVEYNASMVAKFMEFASQKLTRPIDECVLDVEEGRICEGLITGITLFDGVAMAYCKRHLHSPQNWEMNIIFDGDFGIDLKRYYARQHAERQNNTYVPGLGYDPLGDEDDESLADRLAIRNDAVTKLTLLDGPRVYGRRDPKRMTPGY